MQTWDGFGASVCHYILPLWTGRPSVRCRDSVMYKEHADYRSLSDVNRFPDTAGICNLTPLALFAECILISSMTPMPAGEHFPGRNRSSRICSRIEKGHSLLTLTCLKVLMQLCKRPCFRPLNNFLFNFIKQTDRQRVVSGQRGEGGRGISRNIEIRYIR